MCYDWDIEAEQMLKGPLAAGPERFPNEPGNGQPNREGLA